MLNFCSYKSFSILLNAFYQLEFWSCKEFETVEYWVVGSVTAVRCNLFRLITFLVILIYYPTCHESHYFNSFVKTAHLYQNICTWHKISAVYPFSIYTTFISIMFSVYCLSGYKCQKHIYIHLLLCLCCSLVLKQ
jgi:hypothetical protein